MLLYGDMNKAKNKLETGMPPPGFCHKIYIVGVFDRNQNLLCTPLVYMHEYGPYKTLKKYINEVSLHISGWTDGQGPRRKLCLHFIVYLATPLTLKVLVNI
jgi:hypothetical protein